jgi:hypothetical protein
MTDGLRPITVDGRCFRWRFDGRLVVIPADRSGPQLRVDWGWRDWLEPEGRGPEPSVVTPSFVAEAVRFALANGWQPERTGPPFRLGFGACCFRVTGNTGDA